MPQTRPKRDGVPVIDFQNVTKQYANGTKALDHISLHIDKGEFVFVVGASAGYGIRVSEEIQAEGNRYFELLYHL